MKLINTTSKKGTRNMKPVPNRPAISDVLVKASANNVFCAELLSNSQQVLAEMNLPADDYAVLSGVEAPSLKEFAREVKLRLLLNQ
jgi:hypothetical protein